MSSVMVSSGNIGCAGNVICSPVLFAAAINPSDRHAVRLVLFAEMAMMAPNYDLSAFAQFLHRASISYSPLESHYQNPNPSLEHAQIWVGRDLSLSRHHSAARLDI